MGDFVDGLTGKAARDAKKRQQEAERRQEEARKAQNLAAQKTREEENKATRVASATEAVAVGMSGRPSAFSRRPTRRA